MREDKCGRARRDFTHSIFSSISRTSEYGSTFYHMRLTVSQWCRMRCAMWPCSVRSYRTVSLAVHYCGPAACLRASSPKSPNPIRFPWARIKQPQSQGGRIVSGGPNSANVQLTSRHSVLLRLFTPTINSNVHLQRIQIAWQDRPHHWRKRRYRRGNSLPTRPLITAADKSYICANIHFQATAILFAKVPACAMFIRLSEAIL